MKENAGRNVDRETVLMKLFIEIKTKLGSGLKAIHVEFWQIFCSFPKT